MNVKWIAGYPLLLDVGTDVANAGLDACTLNNALNVAQLVVLIALLRWVRERES